jgi:hypothetical protein
MTALACREKGKSNAKNPPQKISKKKVRSLSSNFFGEVMAIVGNVSLAALLPHTPILSSSRALINTMIL